MDSHLFLLWLLTTTFTPLSRAVPVSENFVVLVKPSLSVRSKHSTTLPCWISPPQSAENLEVRWYRKNFDTPIMLYRSGTIETDPQEASYLGRVSFGLKDAESRGVKDGDVSLELVNVTLADAADYTCYVSSEQGYDSETMQLIVTQSGASPLLSVTWVQDDLMRVSCESEGWYPEPQLRWSDQKQDLSPKGLTYTKDASGLVSVHSWIHVSGPSNVSCSVGLAGEEATEGRLHLMKFIPPNQGPSVDGWMVVSLLLIAVILGVLIFKYRGLIFRKKSKSTNHDAEAEMLLPPVSSTAFEEAFGYYVNIQLENTDNEFVLIRGNMLRDKMDPGRPSPPCATAVRGTVGFSSGKHYWEVSLWSAVNNGISIKESWWLGVTSMSPIPLDRDPPPTVADGFWFLSSCPDKAGTFQFSTNPAVSFQVQSPPKTVGVFLNCDDGELSFYDAEEKILIGTFTAQFKGKVFPLFNPGQGDRAPMEVMMMSTVAEASENSAQDTVITEP